MKLDMHFHSTNSDGLFSREELILKAQNQNLDFIALTDHDVVSHGFREKASEYGIKSCQSVEISAYNKKHDKSLHLTFYAREIGDTVSKILSGVIIKKQELINKQIDFFASIGFIINKKDFYDFFRNFGRNPSTLNKFDIVRFMFLNNENIFLARELNNGVNINIEEFYYKFLKRGGEKFEKYAVQIESYETPVETCKDIVKNSNGILSIPHPNTTFRNGGIEEFKKVLPYYIEIAGVNAIEINTYSTKEWINAILKAKDRYSLYLTFGSDFHKENHNDNKHGNFGELNPLLNPDFISKHFLEYRDIIIS